MAVSAPMFVPYEMKTSVIDIYEYEGKNPRGVLTNPLYEGRMSFENLTQLLFLIEQIQDELSYPQKTMETRSFKPPGHCVRQSISSETPEKILATFRIKILFRQNASWQGSIVWADREQESQFRSVLELIHLIDSALTPANE